MSSYYKTNRLQLTFNVIQERLQKGTMLKKNESLKETLFVITLSSEAGFRYGQVGRKTNFVIGLITLNFRATSARLKNVSQVSLYVFPSSFHSNLA